MWGAAFVSALLALSQSDAVSDDEQRPIVKKLVRALESAEKSARDEAERTLRELGPEILELLPEIDDRTPAEVALRLTRVRVDLEKLRGEDAVRGTTVTLAGKKKLSELLAAISSQTGNKVVDYRDQFGEKPEDLTLDVAFDKTPFWQALEKVLDDAKLAVYPTPDRDTLPQGIALVARPDSKTLLPSRAAYSGAFRFEATQATARRDLKNPAGSSLQIILEASWEPRLAPIVLLFPLDALQAFDEAGKPLSLAGASSTVELPVGVGWQSMELPLRMELPPRSVSRIASLKGRLDALVPGRTETFRFEKLVGAEDVSLRKGGVSVVIDSVGKNNELHEIRLSVVFDKASGALESHRTWVFDNPAWLETPDGKRLDHLGIDVTKQLDSEIGVSYLFGLEEGVDSLAGHTFVYQTPSAIARLPIEFELKDLELP